jgi:predicted CXXCH cytochrome family protein
MGNGEESCHLRKARSTRVSLARPLQAGNPLHHVHRPRPRFPAVLLLLLCACQAAVANADPVFVGSRACAGCHEPEYRAWRGSHHDLAMAEPTEETMLGDFGGASHRAHGVTSSFLRRDGDWVVRTDGPDGELTDYRIAYTFGWYPLQQYLVSFPGGRYQALPLAWDSRPVEDGGQRWFHLYPDEADMGPGHPLHWTGREQNWNYQCAECHSTALRKGYDIAKNSFDTTWAEIDVACEACHGAGSRHRDQAQRAAAGDVAAWDQTKGLPVVLADGDGGAWSRDPETGKPVRSAPRSSRVKIELCARCHSRRGQIHEQYEYGQPLGNTHRLSLLDAHLYHPDGQILDEVYVYGSFVQSRMYRAGVTCTDCHDAHSLRLKADGDLVCFQCHEAGRYAAEGHHRHPADSSGASCVGCHMPQRNYMVIDARADHSMRIPRPDLSLELGTPNACIQCHAERDDRWAAERFKAWYGDPPDEAHFGRALHAGRAGLPGAGGRLLTLAADREEPGIVRATALEMARDLAEPAFAMALPRLLEDPDPLVRGAAVRFLEATDARTRLRLGMPLLEDPIRTVRLDAARVLAPLLGGALTAVQSERLAAAIDAYRAALLVTAERPESHLNLGLLESRVGRLGAARRAYRQAIRLDPAFAPAYVNLADLYRGLGGDEEGEAVLKEGIGHAPNDASLHHALGLLQVRAGRLQPAVVELGRAAELAPGQPRYAYVHALAIRETGDLPRALEALERAHDRHPTDPEILLALATFSRDAGARSAALRYARRLAALDPEDPQAAALLRELSNGH